MARYKCRLLTHFLSVQLIIQSWFDVGGTTCDVCCNRRRHRRCLVDSMARESQWMTLIGSWLMLLTLPLCRSFLFVSQRVCIYVRVKTPRQIKKPGELFWVNPHKNC